MEKLVVRSGVVGVALALVACGGSPAQQDAGVQGDGGSTPDAGNECPLAATATLPLATTGTVAMPEAAPADFACAGTRVAPTPGADISYTFNATFFSLGGASRSTRVWFFPDNMVRDTCDPAVCQEIMTDTATGSAAVHGPASAWYAYRVFAHAGPTSSTTVMDSAQYNEAAPDVAGGTVTGNVVAQQTIDLIPAVFGYERAPGTTLLAGRVFDCAGDPIRGAVFRIYEGGAPICDGTLTTETHLAYFDGNETPDGTATYTNVDGLYAAINVPIPADPTSLVRVEAWGRTAAGDPASGRRLGCEAIRVITNAVTIVNIGPLRSDYPVGHPCAGL